MKEFIITYYKEIAIVLFAVIYTYLCFKFGVVNFFIGKWREIEEKEKLEEVEDELIS